MSYDPAYKKLQLYRSAHQLVLRVYRLTARYPREEQFGLTSQMRRASVSVPANIIEGWARSTHKDKRSFYIIARGSLAELLYYLDLSAELSLISQEDAQETQLLAEETMRLLQGLINKFT